MGCHASDMNEDPRIILTKIHFKPSSDDSIDELYAKLKDFLQFGLVIVHRLELYRRWGFQLDFLTIQGKLVFIDTINNSPSKLRILLEEIKDLEERIKAQSYEY
mmetsp:Transcript_8383/g.7453  ORF Transcript_8383/g.7453 Transcript_8383/m.7453 type:complete len:104 (-) Transcript_8383:438-749(-)